VEQPAAGSEPPAKWEMSAKVEQPARVEPSAKIEPPAKVDQPAGLEPPAKVELPAKSEPPAKVEEQPARVEQTAKVEQAPVKAPEAEIQTEPAPATQRQFKFVVQVGSFPEKEGAEEMQVTLLKKGYPAVVRRVKDRVKGMIYVLQLKPVDTLSKASTMAIQLESEVRSSPTVVRVPGN
jgi:cell division septation protein DedD